jgi:bacteriocin biosynthesis cyclodehydratase domain-containing protein
MQAKTVQEENLVAADAPQAADDEGLLAGNNKEPAPPRLVINPYLHVVVCSDDEVVVKHGSRSAYSQVLSDDGNTHLIGRALRVLRTPMTEDEIMTRGGLAEVNRGALRELLDYLRNRRIVIEAGEDRAGAYLDCVLGNGDPLAARIRSASVAVVGAGPYGAHVAERLAALRPGRLVLLDLPACLPDPGTAAAGRDAARELAERLADRCPGAEPVEGDLVSVWETLAACQLVLVCYERFSPQAFHAFNEAAIERPVPWLLSYLDGSDGIIHPVAVPGETACYYELEAQSESTLTRRPDYHLYKEEMLAPTDDVAAAPLAVYTDVLGGMTVIAALRHLTGLPPLASDQTIRIDFERMAIDYQTILKLPRCPACSGLRPAHRHLFM